MRERVEVAVGGVAAPAVLDDHHVAVRCVPGRVGVAEGRHVDPLVVGAARQQHRYAVSAARGPRIRRPVHVGSQHRAVAHRRGHVALDGDRHSGQVLECHGGLRLFSSRDGISLGRRLERSRLLAGSRLSRRLCCWQVLDCHGASAVGRFSIVMAPLLLAGSRLSWRLCCWQVLDCHGASAVGRFSIVMAPLLLAGSRLSWRLCGVSVSARLPRGGPRPTRECVDERIQAGAVLRRGFRRRRDPPRSRWRSSWPAPTAPGCSSWPTSSPTAGPWWCRCGTSGTARPSWWWGASARSGSRTCVATPAARCA